MCNFTLLLFFSIPCVTYGKAQGLLNEQLDYSYDIFEDDDFFWKTHIMERKYLLDRSIFKRNKKEFSIKLYHIDDKIEKIDFLMINVLEMEMETKIFPLKNCISRYANMFYVLYSQKFNQTRKINIYLQNTCHWGLTKTFCSHFVIDIHLVVITVCINV